MLLTIDLTARDDDAAGDVARHLQRYFDAHAHDNGLTSYLIGRHEEHRTRMFVVEEWETDAHHAAFLASDPFAAMQRDLAPLLAAPAVGNVYETVGRSQPR
jgi:quinol monooxygenase YgiN